MKKVMIKRDKRGAMEMALGTVVTVVLLVSVCLF